MNDKAFSPNDLGIFETDWQQTPPAVRGALSALHAELAKIKEQLKLNSDTYALPTNLESQS